MYHKDEIRRWADLPDRTRVFTRLKNSKIFEWTLLQSAPTWLIDQYYIVDDNQAHIRKTMIDYPGTKLQYKTLSHQEDGDPTWVDSNNLNGILSDGMEYRIKPINLKIGDCVQITQDRIGCDVDNKYEISKSYLPRDKQRKNI